jgi:ribosomal protein S18 acetylase RimI-like enzyme
MDGRFETVRMLEQCMLNAWPSARAVHCDGWVFRSANGYTKRANSAHALAPSDGWGSAYAAARGLSPAEAAAHAVILQTIALPTAYATWRVDGVALAFGLGVLDYGRLGLFDIATAAEARRQGAARKVVSSLLGWGKSLGADTAWLSVIADNDPAIALYENFGFGERYRYHYRAEPGAASALPHPGFAAG